MVNEFVEEIENRRKTSFTISSITVKDLKEFKEYCKEECGDIYHVGIVQLLKTKKQFEQFLSLFHALQLQIDQLQEKTNNPKKEIKTFG